MKQELAPVPPPPTRQPEESFVAFERRAFYDRIVWHEHHDVEMTLVLEGHGTRGTGDAMEEYADGDLCLLAEGTPHGWEAETREQRVRALVVHFPRSVFSSPAATPELRKIGSLLDQARGGLAIGGRTRDAVAEQLLSLFAEPRGSWRRPIKLLETLAILSMSTDLRRLSRRPPAARPADPRLEQVLAYIERSLPEGISHREAASIAGLSLAAFSRFFRRKTQRTFGDYANELRIGRACRELSDHEKARSIAEIAFDAGFNSVSHFNRCFREAKGMTPRSYRLVATQQSSRSPTK